MAKSVTENLNEFRDTSDNFAAVIPVECDLSGIKLNSPQLEADTKSVSSNGKRRIKKTLHFCDGTLDVYETDEDDLTDGVSNKSLDGSTDGKQEESNCRTLVDPKQLTWGPYLWHYTVRAGFKGLEVCDYLGEHLARFLHITTPKYQYEIDEYYRMKEEEERQAKQMELESVGWQSSPSNIPVTEPVNKSTEQILKY